MIHNLPLKSLVHKGWTVEGYSRAAVQSYWRVPELRIGFDLGAQPWDFMGTGMWFVSHMHLDHCASLPVYVARRRMMKMDPPVIYLPEHAVDPMHQVLRLFSRMDRSRMPCELIAAKPGDEIELTREHVVSVVETKHTVPSLGFIVWERRRKLKLEYQNLPGDKIRDIRLSGVDVSEERRSPFLAYLGDSTPDGLDNNPAMYDAEILIAEMTFVSPGHRKDKIHKFGHMHLDDYVERRDRFKNEVLIAAHASTRYHERQVREFVARAFPDLMGGRLHLWL